MLTLHVVLPVLLLAGHTAVGFVADGGYGERVDDADEDNVFHLGVFLVVCWYGSDLGAARSLGALVLGMEVSLVLCVSTLFVILGLPLCCCGIFLLPSPLPVPLRTVLGCG